MFTLTKMKKAISLFLIALMIATPVLAQQAINDYTQGRRDGERDAKGNVIWFLGGFCLGGTGIIGAYITKSEPPTMALLGKSSEYILGYTEGYQKKNREKNTMYACAGGLTLIATLVIVLINSPSAE